MPSMWRIKEKRRVLRVCAIAIVSFCVLAAAIDFSRNLRAFAATTTYTTTIGVNDAQLGEFSTGQDCNGTKNTSYTGTKSMEDNPYWTPGVGDRLTFPNWDITACSGSNARFVEWQVNGLSTDITGRTINPNTLAANSTASNSITSNTTNTITAVFESATPTTFVIAPNSSANGGVNTVNNTCGNDTVYGGQTVYLDSNGRLDISAWNIVACANEGHNFSLWLLDGEEISRNSQIGKDFRQWPDDGQQHTLTAVFTGSGLMHSVTIVTNDPDKEHPTYGKIRLPSIESGTNHYISEPDNQDTTTIDVLTDSGNVVTDYLIASPESGYFVDSVVSSNGSTTITPHENQENKYTLSITGDDTVTVNFREYTDVVYTVSVNNRDAGSIDIQGGNCSAATKTNQPFTRTLIEDQPHSTFKSELDTGGNWIQACLDNPNYVFDHWEIDNLSFSGVEHPSLDPVGYWPKTGNNHVLRAVFTAITPYTVGPNDPTLGGTSLGDDCSNSTSSDRSLTYYAGEFHTNEQSIRACPAQGANFVRWELDGNTYSNQAVIPYNANNLSSDGQTHVLRAVFESTVVTPYTVGSDNYSYGSYVIGYDCNSPESTDRSLDYVSGTFVTPNNAPIMACPLNGNAFLRWELDGQPYSQNAQIAYNASDLPHNGEAHTLRAVFGHHNTVTVRPSNNSYGSIVGIESGSGYTTNRQGDNWIITTDGGTVTTGTITMQPATNMVFIGFTSTTGNTTWTKGATDEEYTLTINGDDELIAEFRTQTKYQIDVQNQAKGGYDIVDGSCASDNIKTETTSNIQVVKTSIGPVLDTIPNIAACPLNGGAFLYWYIDGKIFSTNPVLSNADEHIINDYGDHHITAVFGDQEGVYTVTVKADNPNNGSVSIENGTNYNTWGGGGSVSIQPYTIGPITTGILTVTPASGYVFDYFSSEADNTSWTKVGENQYLLDLTGFDTVTAHFRSSEIQVRYVIGPDDDVRGGVNTKQNTCGDETSRADIITGLDSNNYIDIPADNLVACPNTNFAFDHWELDGQTIPGGASLSKSAQEWPTTGTHELRAIFIPSGSEQTLLPHTGSVMIWLILGGGIGLIAIPSAILILNERKEQRKRGKK